MENVSATAKAAKVTYYAYRMGFVSYENAVSIITKVADTLYRVVPRGPSGINTLWPHFTENGGTTALPPRNGFDGTEWSTGDTACAALDMIAALQMIGDPQGQIPQFENYLKGINWTGLLSAPGLISHGYYYNGARISADCVGFGMETIGTLWAYASATGNLGQMQPPPSDNGSGFIDNLQCPLVFSGNDAWGNDWDLYRQNMAALQLGWYASPPHYNRHLANIHMSGLSAAEPPDIAFGPAEKYVDYGTGGKGAPEDGNDDVVVLHYSGMIAGMFPAEATRMWEALR
ncbi:MAG: hypothetical protein Q8O57_14025, partial [Kiritimatiellota bacterium]|nr:hypothetical protein [Kiritimatiellota bacterium]